MKKLLWLLAILMPVITLAQDDSLSSAMGDARKNLSERNRIIYHQKQYLRRQGQSLHFIKMDLEWPRFLDYSSMPGLQHFLTKEIFGIEAESMEVAMEQYLTAKGEPLERVPDEEGLRSYYSFLSVTELEYVTNRYVSLRLVNRFEPKDTAEQAVDKQRLITYDIAGDQVLTTQELLRNSARQKSSESYMELLQLILLRMDEEEAEWIDFDHFPGEMCLMRAGAYYDLGLFIGSEDYHGLTILTQDELQPFLHKKTKAMLKAEIPERQPEPVVYRPWYADTAEVFTVAEEMASFRGSTEAVYKYLRENCNYPAVDASLGIEGRVVVQFVVEKDGSISSPTVVAPVSPGLDREAVRLVLSMPRWMPAQINGHPVRSIASLPIGFSLP